MSTEQTSHNQGKMRSCDACGRTLPWTHFIHDFGGRDCLNCATAADLRQRSQQEHDDRNHAVFLEKYRSGERGESEAQGFSVIVRERYIRWMERMRSYQPAPPDFDGTPSNDQR
jgi:hypothetical protein